MALLYGLLWRLLLLLVHVNRALVSWLRVWLRNWKDRLWERAMESLQLPVALAGFPDHQKKLNHNPDGNTDPVTGNHTVGRRSRWISDGQSMEKLPVHIGLLVAEEEPSYTDIANLVVWCMAVGISYVSVYDNHGIFRKNNSRLLEEIVRQQQDLLGTDGSIHNVEFLNKGSGNHQHQVVSCRSTVKVLSPEDGKQSIVQAAQRLCRAVENKERTSKDISVSMLDILLRESKNLPDPELVLKFGPVDSTLGFLPWHIRLTEFISLPSHKKVSYEDLLGALQRDLLVTLVLGQVLSLLICAISLISKYLADDFHAHTPVFQGFLNYILLFLVYTTTLAVRQGEGNLLAMLKQRWWKYMILGLIDIEANYLVLKAYQYTTLSSVQVSTE
ncbi:hypothetical protein INR49_031996 [Caranx melampygus]|nr:hypothetical protein INR49_031996 [Caranx melampygus]